MRARSRLSGDVRWLLPLLASCGAAMVLYAQTIPASLILVSTGWPPFTNPAGQPRLALDLVETALGRAGLAAETRFVPEEDFTRALLSGPFDGSAAAWRDTAREQALVFSQPYLENRLVLVARSGADVSARTLGQLPGKRVAIVGGYAYGDGIHLTAPVFVRSRGEEHSLTLLLDGSVDYALIDDLVVHRLRHHHPQEVRTRLQIGSTPLVRRELHLVVRRSRADARIDHRALQRAAARHGCRSHVPSPAPRRLDSRRRRRRRRCRVRALQRFRRPRAPASRLLAVHGD